MSMISFPFDSMKIEDIGGVRYDRAIDMKTYRKLLAQFYKNGVFAVPSNCFQVIQNGTMGARVMGGKALINGAFAIDDEETVITFEKADTLPRIDRVVLRLDDNVSARNISIKVIKGTPASSPNMPALQRDGSIYDLCLANVRINSNTATVTDAQIEDRRMVKNDCGFVTGTIEEVDTTTLYNQYQSALEQYLDIVQNALDGTTAGKIQQEINTIKKNLLTQNDSISALEARIGNKCAGVGFDENPVLKDGEFYIFLDKDSQV